MELKEGMYVRTKEGLIDKVIIDYKGCCNCINCNCKHVSCEHNYYDEKDIIKSSDDITVLIKAGDVIETPKGIFQVGYIENNVIYTDDSKVIACLRKDEHLCFENNIIKSIVTKEQFASVKYEVEYEKI